MDILIIQAFQNVLDGVDEGDEEKMARSLEEIAEIMPKATKTHRLMHGE